MMETQQSWSVSSSEQRQQKMSLVALLFFMMGALNIYIYLQRTKQRVNSEVSRLFQLSLLAAIIAGVLEIYNYLTLSFNFL